MHNANGRKQEQLDSPTQVYARMAAQYRNGGRAPEDRDTAPPRADERPRLDTATEVYRRMNAYYDSWGKREGVR